MLKIVRYFCCLTLCLAFSSFSASDPGDFDDDEDAGYGHYANDNDLGSPKRQCYGDDEDFWNCEGAKSVGPVSICELKQKWFGPDYEDETYDSKSDTPLELKKGAFSSDEDELLKALYIASSKKDERILWEVIAKKMNRTACSVFNRYTEYLNPRLNKGSWTPEEKRNLEEGYKAFGPKWAQIKHVYFNGTRSASDIKNTIQKMQRQRQKQLRQKLRPR